MIRHIFFDNDGTIVDSEILAVRSMLKHLAPLGFAMDEKTYSQRFPGLLEKDILAILEREFQIIVPGDFIQRLHHEHVDLFDNHLKAIDGMDHLFRRITIPKSMVSNGSVLHVERCLQRVGLLEDFKGHIFSANQVARPKPWPDVYLHAMQVTGVAPHEAVVVEDSPTGVDAAKAAGLRVIGFLGAAHITDGHDEELLRRGADFIAADSEELEAILANLL